METSICIPELATQIGRRPLSFAICHSFFVATAVGGVGVRPAFNRMRQPQWGSTLGVAKIVTFSAMASVHKTTAGMSSNSLKPYYIYIYICVYIYIYIDTYCLYTPIICPPYTHLQAVGRGGGTHGMLRGCRRLRSTCLWRRLTCILLRFRV